MIAAPLLHYFKIHR